MAILYTVVLEIGMRYEGLKGSGSPEGADGADSGRRRRRRDHEYAARAQIPENMYASATTNSTTFEKRRQT
jgi:hypothetical protein